MPLTPENVLKNSRKGGHRHQDDLRRHVESEPQDQQRRQRHDRHAVKTDNDGTEHGTENQRLAQEQPHHDPAGGADHQTHAYFGERHGHMPPQGRATPFNKARTDQAGQAGPRVPERAAGPLPGKDQDDAQQHLPGEDAVVDTRRFSCMTAAGFAKALTLSTMSVQAPALGPSVWRNRFTLFYLMIVKCMTAVNSSADLMAHPPPNPLRPGGRGVSPSPRLRGEG